MEEKGCNQSAGEKGWKSRGGQEIYCWSGTPDCQSLFSSICICAFHLLHQFHDSASLFWGRKLAEACLLVVPQKGWMRSSTHTHRHTGVDVARHTPTQRGVLEKRNQTRIRCLVLTHFLCVVWTGPLAVHEIEMRDTRIAYSSHLKVPTMPQMTGNMKWYSWPFTRPNNPDWIHQSGMFPLWIRGQVSVSATLLPVKGLFSTSKALCGREAMEGGTCVGLELKSREPFTFQKLPPAYTYVFSISFPTFSPTVLRVSFVLL